jgi:integrase
MGPFPEAYTRYRAVLGRPVQLIALVRHVRWLSLFFRDGLQILEHPLHPSDFGLPVRTTHVPRRWRQRSSDMDVSDSLSLAGSSDRFSLSTLGVEDRGEPIDWIRPTATGRGLERVHYFQASEIRALYLACNTLFERILLTSLFTTGMRIGGFCSLAYQNPITNEIRGIEKGNIPTTYCVTDVLRALLGEWLTTLPHRTDRQYLFPGRDAGPDSHIASSTVRRTFHSVARRAGVTGSHVHPHTTRHTVAWTLHALGNSVEQHCANVGCVANVVYFMN